MRSITRSICISSIGAIRLVLAHIWLLACVMTIAGALSSLDAQTNINIGTTVKQSGVKRFGINLANQDFYDSGMMLRNLIFRNPGFEGQTWETILTCAVVTSTSCQDSNPYSTWPANYMQNATYTFMTGPAAGLSGTVTSMDAASYTGNTGAVLHYAAPARQPVVNDIVQVRTVFPGGAERGWFIQNQSGAVLSTDSTPSDQAPGTTGKQCLQVTGPNGGQSVQVSQIFDVGEPRSFLQLNGSYTITFKARSTGGSSHFNLQVLRLENPTQVVYLNQTVNLTNSWADYSYTFNAAETGSAYGPIEASFNFDGNSLLLDDVQMSPDKNVYGTAFRDEVVSTLLTLKPGVLRYMDTAQGLGTPFDNILKDQYGRQRAGWSQGTGIDTVPVGLYEFLKLCQVVGAEPWWTMPTAMNQTEMQHVMEYMAGSSGTPYGAIRAAQGQTAPWTTVFPVIHLELGNEVWNGGSFSGETIVSPDRFGQWANTVFSAAKATSYYAGSSNKFDFVMGSIEVNDFWTQYEMDNCSACDTLAIAAYMFGNFSDYSSTEAIFGPLMAYPEWLDGAATTGSYNHMYLQTQVASGVSVSDAWGTKNPRPVAIYETNLGTNSGTAPQAIVNSTVASVGAGISEANHMLMMLRDLGVKTQNMFALTEYANGFYPSGGSTASTTPLWGTVIDMGVTNLKRPQFLGEQLTNSAILPTMLATTHTGDNPTWNQPLSANDQVKLNNVHYLQSYAFTDGTNHNLIVMNLHRTASLPVTFSGASAPSGSIKVSQLTSGNITDTNETSPKVNITYKSISNFDPTKPYSLPPFSMTVFEPGAALPVSSTTITATPTAINVGQNVSLSAVVTSQSGTTTPTGTVTFLDGTTSLGTATLDGSGVATFSTTGLAGGSHTITASYGGDSSDGNSVSSAVVVTVSQTGVGTTTSLATSATTATTGQSVTLTATVAAQSGTGIPTGTVTFSDGTTTLGTGTLNSGGVATFSTTTLSVGAHGIKASYGGDTQDTASASSIVTVTISAGVVATTASLTYTPSSPMTVSDCRFFAKIAPASGSRTPTGTVTFKNGSTVMGTATVDGTGTATLDAGTLYAGTYNVTAIYGGDSGDSASTSSVAVMTVAPATTVTALTASSATATAGQSVTFTATVANGMSATGTVTFKDGTTTVGTSALNGTGAATFATTTLSPGPHSITASYGGDTQNATSVSSAVTVTISQTVVATTTTLSASAITSATGQGISFTATVSPQSGTNIPSGTVTFFDGTTSLGSGPLSAAGTFTFTTSALGVGAHSITASYGGDTKDSASASSSLTVTISQAAVATTTTLTASATTATAGQNVSFTAVVAPQSGTVMPTGVVAFSDGGTNLGTGTLNGSGVATFSSTTLGVGGHSIRASYGGDTKDTTSASTNVTVTISQTVVATTTGLTASMTSVTTGQNVSFTASVAPRSGTSIPTGTITISDGLTTLGTGILNASGIATFNTTSLGVGPHNLTATYSGDGKNAASASSAVVLTVSQGIVATTTRLLASAVAVTAGQKVSFTATVAPQSGTVVPTGTVAFSDAGKALGTGTLNSSGVVTFTTTTLAVGSHSIAASYGGDTRNGASASQAATVLISQAAVATTTSLSASPSTANTGQSVTFTATVARLSGTIVPTGTVTFGDGQVALGTAPVNASGVATFSTAALGVGNHTIFATYGGDTNDSASISPAVTVGISQSLSVTTTSLMTSATTASTGQLVTLSATVVAPSGTMVPTGTVTFLDGSTTLSTVTLGSNGTASFATSSLAIGSHTIVASYSGDSKDKASTSSSVVVTVSQSSVATTTALVANPSSTSTGQNVALTATVAPISGTGIPTGTVKFLDGATLLAALPLNASGSATFASTSLTAGVHSITASYGGDTKDAASTSPTTAVTISQTILATNTSLRTNAATASTGQSVTLTATVAPSTGNGVPSGMVTFLDGGVALGTATLSATGAASFSTTTLAIGAHSMTASYGGDAKDAASLSSAVTVTISQSIVATSTTISASAAFASAGQSVTFSATVTAQSGSGTPGGPVTFLDGTSVIGTGNLSAGVARFAISTLSAGTHTVTASYGGDVNDAASVSSATTVGISQPAAPTTTVLSASPAQAIAGQSITLTTTVTPQSGTGTPGGSITFMDGGAVVGAGNLSASGTASFAISTLGVGIHTMTASYGGDTKDAASVSSAVTVTISQAVVPTTTVLSLSTPQSTLGQNVTFIAVVVVPAGKAIPTGTVTFLNGQAALGAGPLNATGTATFSTAALAAGTYSITAAYSSNQFDAASVSPAVTLTVASAVAPPPDYTLSLNIASVSVATGKSASATVSVTPQNGFNQSVQLSCSGLPSGSSCTFAPATVTPNGEIVSSTVTIATNRVAALGVLPIGPPLPGVAYGMLMPWGLISLLGMGARGKGSRSSFWTARLLVTTLLIGASFWMTGCGYTISTPSGSQAAKTPATYIVTISAAGANAPTHTSALTVQVMP